MFQVRSIGGGGGETRIEIAEIVEIVGIVGTADVSAPPLALELVRGGWGGGGEH